MQVMEIMEYNHHVLTVAVNRGAQFLDEREPYWFKRIESELQMINCTKCILGQVFGDYYDAVESFWCGDFLTEDDWAYYHGFSLQMHEWSPIAGDRSSQWDSLRDMWDAQIATRKSNG